MTISLLHHQMHVGFQKFHHQYILHLLPLPLLHPSLLEMKNFDWCCFEALIRVDSRRFAAQIVRHRYFHFHPAEQQEEECPLLSLA